VNQTQRVNQTLEVKRHMQKQRRRGGEDKQCAQWRRNESVREKQCVRGLKQGIL